MCKTETGFFHKDETTTIFWRKFVEYFWVLLVFCLLFSAILFMLFFLGLIFMRGSSSLSFQFLTGTPKDNMTAGGIFPAIMGTIMVTLVSGLASIVMGIISGIYLAEYAKEGRLKRIIWVAVKNLAGIPSVIYGLFGLAIFVDVLGMKKSILTAGLTLGILALPVMITATVEAIQAIPFVSRQASFGLGASRWQTLSRTVLPSAFPGILTGMILSLTRALGETAPILFTGVAYYIAKPEYSLNSSFMALPYHIFALATQNSYEKEATQAAYGSSLVLVLLVICLSIVTLVIRSKVRRKG